MKFVTICCLFSIFSLLTGCMAPASQQVLPEIGYTKPIKTHIAREALINWHTGYAIAADNSVGFAGGGVGLIGLVADVTAAEIIAHHNDHPNPKQRFQFGEYRQAIFMRSLVDTLKKHRVFTNVRFVNKMDKKLLKANQVLLTVNFKSTKVSAPANYQVTLDTVVTLKTQQHTLSKVFFIQPIIKVKDSQMAFKEQQVAAANKLLSNIITMIQQDKAQLVATTKSTKHA